MAALTDFLLVAGVALGLVAGARCYLAVSDLLAERREAKRQADALARDRLRRLCLVPAALVRFERAGATAGTSRPAIVWRDDRRGASEASVGPEAA